MDDRCTVTQAATELGVSRQRTLKMLANGILAGTKISTRFWLVDRASVEARKRAKAQVAAGKASDA